MMDARRTIATRSLEISKKRCWAPNMRRPNETCTSLLLVVLVEIVLLLLLLLPLFLIPTIAIVSTITVETIITIRLATSSVDQSSLHPMGSGIGWRALCRHLCHW